MVGAVVVSGGAFGLTAVPQRVSTTDEIREDAGVSNEDSTKSLRAGVEKVRVCES